MIPVPMPPEPPDFDERVRRPGRDHLRQKSHNPDQSWLLASRASRLSRSILYWKGLPPHHDTASTALPSHSVPGWQT